MKSLTFEEFEQVCYERQIGLHTDVVVNGVLGAEAFPHMHSPSGMLAAMTAACRLIRRDPQTALTQQPLSAIDFDPVDIPASSLVSLLDANYLQTHPDQLGAALETAPKLSGAVRFTRMLDTKVDGCKSAEGLFCETVADIVHERDKKPLRRIFHADGRPVLLQKAILEMATRGQPSALALTDIEIGGLPFRAGCICNIRLTDDAIGQKNTPVVGNTEIMTVSDIHSICCMRLGAFALAPAERGIFGAAGKITREARSVSVMPLREVAQHLSVSLGLAEQAIAA